MTQSLAYGILTLYDRLSHVVQLNWINQIAWSYNPGLAVTKPVWAAPRSLATTWGIILIFCSCGYLDVSVPRVCLYCFAALDPSASR